MWYGQHIKGKKTSIVYEKLGNLQQATEKAKCYSQIL